MEKRPKFIGEILAELGLINQSDIDRALAYQRERGGYFGEALIELGVILPDQLNFGLADQFDLPFVHLRPESIDHDIARMVPPEWARERLVLPVLLDGETVTVIVARPPSENDLATVQRFTCANRVDAAISTADTIRTLISSVHHDGCGEEIAVLELIERARAADATSVGVSSRSGRARGWFRGPAGVVRCCVTRGWEGDLMLALSPMRELPPGSVHDWPAILSISGEAVRVECAYVRSAGGAEWTLELGMEIPLGSSWPSAEEQLLEAMHVRAGTHNIVSAGEGSGAHPELVELMLPLLPSVLLRPRPRSVHVTDRPVACLPDVMVLEVGRSPLGTISALAALELDAITLDLDAYEPEVLAAAGAAAPLIIIRTTAPEEGVGADLDARLDASGDTLLWTLSKPTVPHAAN